MTDKKTAVLDESIEILTRMISACVRIKRGEARSAVFSELKLDNRMFKIVSLYHFGETSSESRGNQKNLSCVPTLNGAERLYLAVANVKSLSDIPSDVDETMED